MHPKRFNRRPAPQLRMDVRTGAGWMYDGLLGFGCSRLPLMASPGCDVHRPVHAAASWKGL